MFPRSALLLIALASLAGCQCKDSVTLGVKDGGSSGGGAGGGSGGRGGGGGSNTGGGAGGRVDGGDNVVVGVGPGGFILDGGSNGTGDGVKLDPDGGVVLNSGSSAFYFMWIANSVSDWVSKYDTRTGREVGRYYAVVPRDCSNSAGPPCAGGVDNGERYNQGNISPSRTAIDIYGDVWVANRHPGGQGTVTKIANDESSCIDRNNNGSIDTSRDLDGDGEISMGEMIVPTDPANIAQYDECVLFTTKVGPAGGDVAARAIAISAGLEGTAGDVWVGIYRNRSFYKLSTANGQIVPVNAAGALSVSLSFGPYGAIVDRDQRLYAVAPTEARLAVIDTATGAVLQDPLLPPANVPCGAYALGVDGKNRIWLAGWTEGRLACRYDRASNTWTSFSFQNAVSNKGTGLDTPRGIAVDAQGVVYMSATSGAKLIRFDSETGAIIKFGAFDFIDASGDAPGASTSIGVGLDGDGNPWVNNYGGNAMKVDKVTGAVTFTKVQPAGLYTYSDFTGYQLRNFTAPRGTYKKVFAGCGADTLWKSITWDAAVPQGTRLEVYLRVADDLAALPTAMRYGPFTSQPVDLVAAGIPKKNFAQIEFVLISTNATTSPVLKSFNLVWVCDGQIG